MPTFMMRDQQPVHVRIIGRGKPLILLHGFAMESRHWLPFAYPLATRYQVIMPDLRGFGRSHHAQHNQDCVLSNFADDIADIMAQHGARHYRLAGISMGALTALQYFRLYGDDKVSKYLHIDQAPRGLNNTEWSWGLFGPEQAQRLDRARRLIAALTPFAERNTAYAHLPAELRGALWHELGDFFASAMSRAQHKRLLAAASALEPLATKLLPTQCWWAYLNCLRAYLEQDYDMRDVLPNLNVPVSLLVGMKSEMYPPGGQLRMADLLRQVSIIPFRDSGHAPLLDEPVKFLRTLFRWAA